MNAPFRPFGRELGVGIRDDLRMTTGMPRRSSQLGDDRHRVFILGLGISGKAGISTL